MPGFCHWFQSPMLSSGDCSWPLASILTAILEKDVQQPCDLVILPSFSEALNVKIKIPAYLKRKGLENQFWVLSMQELTAHDYLDGIGTVLFFALGSEMFGADLTIYPVYTFHVVNLMHCQISINLNLQFTCHLSNAGFWIVITG